MEEIEEQFEKSSVKISSLKFEEKEEDIPHYLVCVAAIMCFWCGLYLFISFFPIVFETSETLWTSFFESCCVDTRCYLDKVNSSVLCNDRLMAWLRSQTLIEGEVEICKINQIADIICLKKLIL